MESEGGVTRSIIDEFISSDTQRDQMDGERGVTRSIIVELHSSDMIKWKVEVVLLEVLSKCYSLFGYPRRSNGRWKWCYSTDHW